ncbi:hypothetical protein LM604_06340 [Candidatus Acetothermia bacterium]|jgi:hypothetical protein|nr:hypothetical protein [Candidatus Acetothermia bacterium]
MAYLRSQVYLRREHQAFLKEAAKKHGVPMTELLRCILDDYIQRHRAKEDFLQIVALGRSDSHDLSVRHDQYLAEALQTDHVR